MEPNHDHFTKRLHELREEFARGEGQLTELDRKRAQVRDTLLRISGAMQVLEELLSQGASVPQPSDTVEPQDTRLAAVG